MFAGGDVHLYGYSLNNPINLIDPLGLIELESIRNIVTVVNIIDVLPIGILKGRLQLIGELIDLAAFVGTEALLLADLQSESITQNQFYLGSALNIANFAIGTTGNWLTGSGNILLSVVEGGILYLQYRVTKPLEPFKMALSVPCE